MSEVPLLTVSASVAPRSYKPEVRVQGVWYDNALRFATETEAKSSAQDLYMRWTQTEGFRAAPSGDEPTHEWIEGQGMRRLAEPEAKPMPYISPKTPPGAYSPNRCADDGYYIPTASFPP